MKKTSLIAALVIGAGVSLSAQADDNDALARFKGGIGSQPLRSGAAVNDVKGVNPGGRPWVIESLEAEVKPNGHIRVSGRGLLLAGGDGVGRTNNLSVHARLFCGNDSFNSATVPLDPDGDFRIEGMLSSVPPSPCDTPILLIVSGVAPAGSWFAAGIPRLPKHTPSPFGLSK